MHHPSAVNGVHHWLNRFNAAIARRYGVPVIDLTDLTRHGVMDAVAGVSEGGVYHKVSADAMVPELLTRMVRACPRVCDSGTAGAT